MKLVEDDAARRLGDHVSQLRERLSALDVVPYGLDSSWTGFRYLASTQHSSGGQRGTDAPGDEYVGVELAHGQHKDRGPMMLIETGRRRGNGDVRSHHHWGIDHLTDTAGRPVELLVDNRRTSAQWWQQERYQLARFQRDGLEVVIRARDWDDLADTVVVRIFDAEPYLSGREIMLYRRRR